MSFRVRLGAALVSAAVLSAAGLLLVLQSGASARPGINYTHLNKIQKRIISETLASALGPQGLKPRAVQRGNDDGGTGDGAPTNPPASYGSPGGTGSPSNYFPTQQQCAQNLGQDVKVNQNCLNVADPALQGRSQANNEPSISVDPFDSRHLVASENNYIRGDGTCGSHFSLDGGRTWQDTTIPNSFTYGPGGSGRQYWQAGGDTSLAWDTRGNAYESCQLFNRGAGASPNPDESSAFVVFRATQNNGASWNFPGRYTTVTFDPDGTSGVLQDKALMAIDDNVHSPYRDRIYVTWTEFAADGTAYIYEVHSNDYGEHFSNRVLVSKDSPLCANDYGITNSNGSCNENQFSDPFVGPDGNLYVAWVNFNNAVSGNDNRNQILLAKSTDGGDSFSAPVKVSDYYDLPDCDTYQGTGADPFRACVPEKGSSTKSVFRATNYPSGQVAPRNPNVVTVAFGSYINKDSNESNGCVPAGFNPTTGINLYTGVKTPGACNNKILLSVSTNGGATFTGTTTDPRHETLVTQSRGQNGTDQFWQWSTFTRDGKLAVDYYDRQYGNDETTGSSDFSLSGSDDLTDFGQVRLTSSSMPAPTEFYGAKGGQFYGDYVWLSAVDKAYAIWSDTREPELFVCPGTATPGHPPALCTGTEPNGQQANDQDTFMATVDVPTGKGHGSERDHGHRKRH